MSLSAELMRFLADHAAAESQAAFASDVGAGATPAVLAAAMVQKGYRVTEDDVIAAFDASKQIALHDEELGAVVGGQAKPEASAVEASQDLAKPNGTASIVSMFEMQMMNRLSQQSEMSTSIISSSNAALAAMARTVKS